MKTILFIGNEYVYSLKHLKEIVQKNSPIHTNSIIYEDLLTSQRDNTLTLWLAEGSKEEKTIAKLINSIPSNWDNKRIVEKLMELITGNESSVDNHNINDYIKVTNIQLEFDGKQYDIYRNKITIENWQGKHGTIRFEFNVKKADFEQFQIKLIDNGIEADITSTIVDLQNKHIGDIFVKEMNVLFEFEGDHYFTLLSENNQIATFHIFLSKSETINVEGVEFKMIYVKGGTFEMGSKDFGPIHNVTLSDFKIGETVVTRKLWNVVMGRNSTDNILSVIPDTFTEFPMVRISRIMCETFIKKLNKLTGKKFRFPTEAEWEYAARGGIYRSGYVYSGSNNIDDVAWYDKNANGNVHPVKRKKQNELGIYDMSGNVWEYCYDKYGSYKKGDFYNPKGSETGESYVCRGGSFSWIDNLTKCSVSYRNYYKYSVAKDNVGLRLAL